MVIQSDTKSHSINVKQTWVDYTAYMNNIQWLSDNFKDIKRKHAGKYVIVFDGKIVISGRNTDMVRNKLGKLSDKNQAFVYYIPRAKEALIV